MSLYRALIIFTFPMVYSFYTRYKGMTGAFAWLIKYLIPCLGVSLCFEGFSALNFLLGMVYVYEFYELGYIQNDCETIKKEELPTLRLNEKELQAYEKYKYLIFAIRIIEILFLIYIMYREGISVSLLLVYATTMLVFYLYNNIRNGFCLVVHLVLMMMRYSAPVLISLNRYELLPILLILFIYPVTLFIERSVKGKFGYKNLLFSKYLMSSYEERYIFRIKYYVALLIVIALATFFTGLSNICVIPIVILLVSSIMTYKNKRLQYNK